MVTKEQMNEVLRQLAAIYPAWKQAIKTREDADNLKRVWWDEFNRLGMTTDDLQRGIMIARKSDSAFLPSLGQFVAWCGGSSTPGKHKAFQESVGRNRGDEWSHPVVFEAAKRTGTYDLRNKPASDIRPLFFEHYADVVNEYRQGAEFRLPSPERKAVEHQPEPGEMPESLRQMVGLLGTEDSK